MSDGLTGKITKGIAGFYYVYVQGYGMYECKAKGVFRKNNQKPLVGDDVVIDVLSMEPANGNIVEILERKNSLIRPAVANIDQAMVIFSLKKPAPNLNLLDRFIIQMEQQNLDTIVCFNKSDLADEEEINDMRSIYERAGYRVMVVSAKEDADVDAVLKILAGKTTTVAGPSGVGKSSLINRMQTKTVMETGSISEKIERGKHTTRHTQIIPLGDEAYILDTPGFSSLELFDLEKEELSYYFKEFAEHDDGCKFTGCSHTHEPVCGIKKAVAEGVISNERYESYKVLLQELAQKKKY
ncbi:MAG: ribosome small subunit-dependent GTPase A [Lachnospiraceae bacterium]